MKIRTYPPDLFEPRPPERETPRRCRQCNRWFVPNPAMRNVSCCVDHGGGCCHYSDTEVPAPERERAVSVLDKMADERRAWLERMRDRLAVLCLLRVDVLGEPQACVTADDAEVLRKTQASLALPADCSPNIMGTVFRTRDWVRSEHPDHVSTTPGSNGNLIYRWRYVGRGAA